MSATTNQKKLDGQGLGWVWACVKSLVSNLASTVETNRIKILGGAENISPTQTFAQNSIITVAKETYINTSATVVEPSHIVTHNNENVTHNGEIVTYGTNTLSQWVKIAG